jgi:phosphatidylserine decarboxylase
MSNLSLGERVAQNTWRLAPKRFFSSVIGWGARRQLPGALGRSLVGVYARTYGLNTAEAELPLAQYLTLQALFTRRLAHGARNMPDDEGAVVAPSDGTICEAGIARAGTLLEAKGSAFTLSQLLADEDLAARLTGGPYVVIYLSPRDYHRVHFPLGGKVVAWSHIPGKLFPVGPRSVRRERGLFARNERFVTVVDSPWGRYAVVMVAAVGVGHVTATYDPEVATHEGGFARKGVRHKLFESPIPIKRGQELGIFNLGSTTVTIFEPGRIQLASLSSDSPVAMGSPLGRIVT